MGGAYQYRNIFARFQTMQRKQTLASAFGIQKENWGTMHFSELQFRKKTPYIALYFTAFQIIFISLLSLKIAWSSPIFFLDFNSPC